MSRDIATTKQETTLTIQQMAALSGMSEYTLCYYEKRLAEWDKFKDLSEEAHGE